MTHFEKLLSDDFLNTPLYGLNSLDFSNVERNLALERQGITDGQPFKPKITSTGTTIVASLYKDGVIIAADSRSTQGNIIANKESMKLHRLTDLIYAAGAGTAADLEMVTERIGAELELFELNSGKKTRLVMAVARLRQHLFQHMGYVSAYLIIGGVDFYGPQLFSVDANGVSFRKPFHSDGSGGYCAMAELEAGFRADMTEDECKRLIIKAVEAGMHGDNMSGNSYNITTITKDGRRDEGPFVPSFAPRGKIENDYKFVEGTSDVLGKLELSPLEPELVKSDEEKMEGVQSQA